MSVSLTRYELSQLVLAIDTTDDLCRDAYELISNYFSGELDEEISPLEHLELVEMYLAHAKYWVEFSFPLLKKLILIQKKSAIRIDFDKDLKKP